MQVSEFFEPIGMFHRNFPCVCKWYVLSPHWILDQGRRVVRPPTLQHCPPEGPKGLST
jgi:hypothetical protein